jgi:hypothetical protein
MIEIIDGIVSGTATSGGGGGSTPVIDELNVTPSTSAQTITAPEGVDGYSPVNVSAVTASIDANIVAGNIKKDVTILGVTGSLEAPITDWYLWKGNSSLTWSPETLTQSGYKSVTFGDNMFVAVGNGVSFFANASDLTTWYESTTTNSYNSVAYGNNYFVAVGSQVLAYKNHTNMSYAWQETTMTGFYNGVTFGLSRFVAVGPQCCAYSYAGYQNWTESTLTGFYEDVACGDGKFVAIGQGYYAYSLDGISWTEGTLTGNTYQSITYGNGLFVAVGGKYFAYSTDGIHWTETHFGTLDDHDMVDTVMFAKDVTFGNGVFVVTGFNCYGYSTDGIHWVEEEIEYEYPCVAFGNDNFVTVGTGLLIGTYSQPVVYTSTLSPSTSSIVYTVPYEASALTITSVGEDTITLSDTNVYSKTTSKINTGANIAREVNLQGVFQSPSYEFSFALPAGTKDVGYRGLYYAFVGNEGLTSVDLSNLESVSRASAFQYAFQNCPNLETVNVSGIKYITNDIDTVTANTFGSAFYGCPKITTVNWQNLEIITGGSAFNAVFYNATGLETVAFPKLRIVVGNSIFYNCFYGCKNLKHVYFNGLTTTSFGDKVNQFSTMFNNSVGSESGGCTVHFPSNLTSTISGLTGYAQNFGGGASGYVTLSFDLPATS